MQRRTLLRKSSSSMELNGKFSNALGSGFTDTVLVSKIGNCLFFANNPRRIVFYPNIDYCLLLVDPKVPLVCENEKSLSC